MFSFAPKIKYLLPVRQFCYDAKKIIAEEIGVHVQYFGHSKN